METAEMERYAVRRRCEERDLPAVQHLIEQFDRDLKATQRITSKAAIGIEKAHTSTLDRRHPLSPSRLRNQPKGVVHKSLTVASRKRLTSRLFKRS
jgi:hypothetical protein